ncbi:hypothetical protein OBBRIDRAFT_792583 [Obba rivulosa]|uniref:Velvet domain-containing protein n=1 Tax=Obba rivulosa TaxID=1052685 RepID=A0A8E2DNS4_9APHY|nr:hypothetical protein OBBRIDRAFT_792583 [Obba rivulosa]
MSFSEQAHRLDATTAPQADTGGPVTFITGPFAGHTLRLELEELQKADLGRKYARKDRRPLDPPSVIQLKLFEVYNPGTDRYFEREFEPYDEVKGFGILCHVDLFPVPDEQASTFSRNHPPGQHLRRVESQYPTNQPSFSGQSPTGPSHGLTTTFSLAGTYHASPGPPPRLPADFYTVPSQAYSSASSSSQPAQVMSYRTYTSSPRAPSSGFPSLSLQIPYVSTSVLDSAVFARHPSSGAVASDVVAYFGDFPIAEGSKCTEALAGATCAQIAIVEYKGKSAMMFIFSDLAVKMEGSFILRYRVFSLFSRVEGNHDVPILAECYGGRFRIYSTKDFPGLRPSTDLTKHLALYGVRLNLRESERKRRRTHEVGDNDDVGAFNMRGPSAAIHSPSIASTSVTTLSLPRTVEVKFQDDGGEDSNNDSDED